METDLVISERDQVLSITLNRPAKRNALTRGLLSALDGQLRRLEQAVPRVVFLAAAGPAFCAGMDLLEMQERAKSLNAAHEWQEDARIYASVLEQLFALPCPTVAVVQGPALAGGLGLVLACDIVLAAQEATFALPEPQRGIVAAMVTPLLCHRVGFGPAHYLLLSGEACTADRALQWGLCHDAVPSAVLPDRVEKLRTSILMGAPSAYALTKSFLNRCQGDRMPQDLSFAMGISAQARESSEAREGLAAFLEKRPPRWQPRASAPSAT